MGNEENQVLEQITHRDPRSLSVFDSFQDPDKALNNLVWIQLC